MKRTLRIVVADNESILRMDLQEMLEKEGHEVVGMAGDGRQAVVLAKKYRPDLVIMDIKMPKMDGLAATQMISKEGYAPTLLLTAFSDPGTVEKAKESGAMAYLVKPVQETQLFPAMEIALSRWQELRQMGDELEQAKDALEARKTLDRAKGILMEAHGLTEQEAYRRMRKYSMERRKTIKEVAEAVIRAAEKK